MADDIQLPDELLNLSNVVEKCPEAFATGSKDIQAAALGATKFVFDLGAFFKISRFYCTFVLSVFDMQRFGQRGPLYRMLLNYYLL